MSGGPRGAWSRLALPLMLAGSVACGGRPAPEAAPEPAEEPAVSAWESTLDSIRTLVAADGHARADSMLARFALEHVGSPDAAEAMFWRALVALDPDNPLATPRDALVAIDGYLAGGVAQPRYVEALLLRRTASALEGALTAPPQQLTVTTLPADSLVRLRAAQDTIRQLRADLERTQAELERIRRRIRP